MATDIQRVPTCVSQDYQLWNAVHNVHIQKYKNGLDGSGHRLTTTHCSELHSVLHHLRCHDMQRTLSFFNCATILTVDHHHYSLHRAVFDWTVRRGARGDHDSLMRRALLSNAISKFVSRTNSYSVHHCVQLCASCFFICQHTIVRNGVVNCELLCKLTYAWTCSLGVEVTRRRWLSRDSHLPATHNCYSFKWIFKNTFNG